jgi:hypothetical protein
VILKSDTLMLLMAQKLPEQRSKQVKDHVEGVPAGAPMGRSPAFATPTETDPAGVKRDAPPSLFRWPTRLLGPAPGLKELNLACWGLFIGFVLVPLFGPMIVGQRTGTILSHILPVDFVYFYGIGKLVRDHSLSRLYDYSLQLKIFTDIYALHNGDTYGPSPYPPFVALFFSLFARLSFLPAYLLWVGISLVLYVAGVGAVARNIYRNEPLKLSLVFCFALGFYPFFISTLSNGQLAALAVFAVGVAVGLELRQRPLLGGIALSVLAYKPTLLLIVVPMLLLTRRFRMFTAFVMGSAAWMLIATAFTGFGIWPEYLRFLGFFRGVSMSHGQSLLKLWEYVDFTSFSFSIPGGRSVPALTIFSCITMAAAAALAVLLWRSAKAGKASQLLAWAATLTWTLLLNLYVPVWDAILVILALLLTLGALKELTWRREAGWVVFVGLLMVLATWNMSATTNRHGSQMMTALLLILGCMQLVLLYRSTARWSHDRAQCVAVG